MYLNNSKYRTLFETLKKDILCGKYSSAKPFPSLRLLMRRHGLSKNTVQRAIDELVHQGLISRKQGCGTFVTRSARSRLIGLVVPGLSYSPEYFHRIISAMVVEAQKNDYSILVDGTWGTNSDSNNQEAVEVAARLIRRKVAGVIYHPVEYSEDSDKVNSRVLDAFARAKIPVVLLDSDIAAWPTRSVYDLVSVDNVGAGLTLANYLMDLGAKNICFLMRNNLIGNLADRVKGVAMGALAAGRKWGRAHELVVGPSDAEAIAKVMRRRPRPDAFICENSLLAAGLRSVLMNLGFAVPKDVMVAGFDDAHCASSLVPPLTTVSWSADTMAEMAFEHLQRRIARPELPPTAFSVPYVLKVGSSTRSRN